GSRGSLVLSAGACRQSPSRVFPGHAKVRGPARIRKPEISVGVSDGAEASTTARPRRTEVGTNTAPPNAESRCSRPGIEALAYERETADVNDDDLLAEQRSYYRARAPEYDEWWQRRGRYDRGEEQLLEWQRQVAVVDDALTSFGAK